MKVLKEKKEINLLKVSFPVKKKQTNTRLPLPGFLSAQLGRATVIGLGLQPRAVTSEAPPRSQ